MLKFQTSKDDQFAVALGNELIQQEGEVGEAG